VEGGREGRLQGGRKESVMAINASESERRSNASVVMPTPRHATDLVDGTTPAAPPCTARAAAALGGSCPTFDVLADFVDA